MFLRQLNRTFHTTLNQLARGQRPRKANPGIAYQLEGLEVQDENEVYNDLGELETDFMQVHKTHRQYEREQKQERERIRRLIIRQKYFREPKLPNLLTYAEKEQMRTLYTQSATEWPIERLAESFPCTAEVVKKIVSSKWRARSAQRVRAHDAAVAQNWELLRKDAKFAAQFPLELRQHLSKFTNRTKSEINAKSVTFQPPPALPAPKSTQFLSIITSCSKYKEQPAQIESKQEISIPKPVTKEHIDRETYIFDEIIDKRPMRLSELKELKLSQISTNSEENPQQVQQLENDITDISPHNYELFNKYEENEIIISQKDAELYEMTPFKSRIHIPRKLKREGAIYRVNDCFYADDGEFLFSVPGLTGKK